MSPVLRARRMRLLTTWINPEKNYRPERLMYSTPSTSSGGEIAVTYYKRFQLPRGRS